MRHSPLAPPVVGPALRMMAWVALPVLLLTSFVPALSLSLPRWLGLL